MGWGKIDAVTAHAAAIPENGTLINNKKRGVTITHRLE